jgi:hypothetical protein
VNAKNFIVYYSCNRQVVEQISKITPAVQVAVFAHDLFVETVDHGDLPTLVVASEQGHFGRVLQLETQEVGQGLDGVVASVHEVAYKNVAVLRQRAALAKEFQQVEKLAVDVAANGDWRGNKLT